MVKLGSKLRRSDVEERLRNMKEKPIFVDRGDGNHSQHHCVHWRVVVNFWTSTGTCNVQGAEEQAFASEWNACAAGQLPRKRQLEATDGNRQAVELARDTRTRQTSSPAKPQAKRFAAEFNGVGQQVPRTAVLNEVAAIRFPAEAEETALATSIAMQPPSTANFPGATSSAREAEEMKPSLVASFLAQALQLDSPASATAHLPRAAHALGSCVQLSAENPTSCVLPAVQQMQLSSPAQAVWSTNTSQQASLDNRKQFSHSVGGASCSTATSAQDLGSADTQSDRVEPWSLHSASAGEAPSFTQLSRQLAALEQRIQVIEVKYSNIDCISQRSLRNMGQDLTSQESRDHEPCIKRVELLEAHLKELQHDQRSRFSLLEVEVESLISSRDQLCSKLQGNLQQRHQESTEQVNECSDRITSVEASLCQAASESNGRMENCSDRITNVEAILPQATERVTALSAAQQNMPISLDRAKHVKSRLDLERDPVIAQQPGKNLCSRIDRAYRNGDISDTLRDHYHTVRMKGNAAAHEPAGYFGTQC